MIPGRRGCTTRVRRLVGNATEHRTAGRTNFPNVSLSSNEASAPYSVRSQAPIAASLAEKRQVLRRRRCEPRPLRQDLRSIKRDGLRYQSCLQARSGSDVTRASRGFSMLFQCFSAASQISLKKIIVPRKSSAYSSLGLNAAHQQIFLRRRKTLSGGIRTGALQQETRVIWRFSKVPRKCVARFPASLQMPSRHAAQVVELRRLRRASVCCPHRFFPSFSRNRAFARRQRIFCLWDLLSDRPGCNQSESNAARLVVRRGFTRQASERLEASNCWCGPFFFKFRTFHAENFRAPGR